MKNQKIAEYFVKACYRGECSASAKSHTGALYIEDGVLFSYGRHYPLGKMQGGRLVINSTPSSQTTGRHRGHLIRAAKANGMADEIEMRAM